MALYWQLLAEGLVFKARRSADPAAPILVQNFQRDTWTQVHFRDERIDSAGQYYPPISTFKPTVVGKYNIRAQVQIKNVLADDTTGSHKITAAIYKDGVLTEENSSIVSNYNPETVEDATVVVETIVDLTQTEIDAGDNEFAAYVKVEGVEEIATDINCAATYGCITDQGITVDDESCYSNSGCADHAKIDFWNDRSTNNDPSIYSNIGAVDVDHPSGSCTSTSAVFGCTDSTADNYDETATVNDGSCVGGTA